MDSLTRADAMDEVRALLVLESLPGIGLRSLRRIVDAFGSAERALAASPARLAAVAGRRAAAASPAPEDIQRIDDGLATCRRLGVRALSWNSADYPEALRHLADPPPVLFLLGAAELLGTPGVTIVGSRRTTARGRDIAHRLGAAIARTGVPVVSGLALGVDAAAHRGALAVGGPTIAVLGSGIDRPSPRSHTRLLRDVAKQGLVVSEFLPGTPAAPHHFPRRNRLLAGLGMAVVVVEAARRSGSLITVEHALDLGVDVFAVPGPIEKPACEGSNALLADGAQPVTSIAGFVQTVCRPSGGGARSASAAACAPSEPAAPEKLAASSASPPLAAPGVTPATVTTGPSARVLSGLDDGLDHPESLAARADLDVPGVLALLSALELDGRVERVAGLRFRRAV